MIKRIGSLLAVVALTASLSACCWGPHWGGGHRGDGPGHYHAVIEAKTMPLTK